MIMHLVTCHLSNSCKCIPDAIYCMVWEQLHGVVRLSVKLVCNIFF